MSSFKNDLLIMGLVLSATAAVCASESVQVFNMCTTNKEVTMLEEKEAIITYEGYKSVEYCDWTIPDSVKKDNHVVILWLENITLPFPNPSSGCQGKLKVPGFGYDCEQPNSHIKDGACWVYTKEGEAACEANFVEDETAEKNLTCKSPLYWKNVKNPAQIGYFKQSGEGNYKRFTIHYKPISCLRTTTFQELGTTTKSRSGNDEEIAGASTTAVYMETSITAVAVIIPIIVIILLPIGFFLWRGHKRQKVTLDKPSNQTYKEAEHDHEVEKNEIPGIDVFSGSPEVEKSQDCENTMFEDGTGGSGCDYTAVNKETENLQHQIHGNSDCLEDPDAKDGSGGVYAAV